MVHSGPQCVSAWGQEILCEDWAGACGCPVLGSEVPGQCQGLQSPRAWHGAPMVHQGLSAPRELQGACRTGEERLGGGTSHLQELLRILRVSTVLERSREEVLHQHSLGALERKSTLWGSRGSKEFTLQREKGREREGQRETGTERDREMTETDFSKKLGAPLSAVNFLSANGRLEAPCSPVTEPG